MSLTPSSQWSDRTHDFLMFDTEHEPVAVTEVTLHDNTPATLFSLANHQEEHFEMLLVVSDHEPITLDTLTCPIKTVYRHFIYGEVLPQLTLTTIEQIAGIFPKYVEANFPASWNLDREESVHEHLGKAMLAKLTGNFVPIHLI
jgi:hypothetical protein